MEMERVTELPHSHMDGRPRKRARARLCWDVMPSAMAPVPVQTVADHKAQLGLFCGQEIGNVTSYASSGTTSDHTTSLFVKGVARNGSPPWRGDDKDGHYIFELGENLTSRCKDLYHHPEKFSL